MKRLIKFILNNSLIETHIAPGRVLLDFIRKDRAQSGTKEGCREGDCGACTVLLGEITRGKIVYRSIASCLTPVGTIHGKHVVTIEGINREHSLTPIQDKFLKEGASQCGYCTPGFILSLTNFFINSRELTYKDAIDYMDGNICRCTGYISIKRAAKKLAERYNKILDRRDRISQLTEWEILPDYFNTIEERLKTIPHHYDHHHKGETFVAGGTDLFVQRADSLLDEEIDFIGNHRGLSYIKEEGGKIFVGGSVTDSEFRESPIIKRYLPEFREFSNLIASTIVRNRASVSGNFVNASPIGDMTIILLALGGELTLVSEEENEHKILLKDFYKGYKKSELKSDEYIREFSFKTPSKRSKFNFEKVSKRKYLDIASVNTAILIESSGRMIEDVKISAGGVWAYPLFLKKTSEFLIGRELTSKNIREAASILKNEINPISDVRGSAEYKSLLLRQLFFSHFIKLFGEYVKMEDLI